MEKIGTERYKYLSKPDSAVMEYLRELIERKGREVCFYEIGVGVGATTLEVAKLFNNSGKIVVFSREEDVLELVDDLRRMGYTNIDNRWGSPSKIYSGYHFQLAKGFVDGELAPFDLAYIDGGHVMHLDAPAACVLKELCEPGGLMLFDDWGWTIGRSPSLRPEVRPRTLEEYDPEQIETAHVQLVCKVVMDTDLRFKFLGVDKDTAVYQKL